MEYVSQVNFKIQVVKIYSPNVTDGSLLLVADDISDGIMLSILMSASLMNADLIFALIIGYYVCTAFLGTRLKELDLFGGDFIIVLEGFFYR